jgi:hypothetical protein
MATRDEDSRSSPAREAAADRAVGIAHAADRLGWQAAVMNLNAVCARCNAILAKGVSAAIGIRETPGPRAIICPSCLAALRPPGPEQR